MSPLHSSSLQQHPSSQFPVTYQETSRGHDLAFEPPTWCGPWAPPSLPCCPLPCPSCPSHTNSCGFSTHSTLFLTSVSLSMYPHCPHSTSALPSLGYMSPYTFGLSLYTLGFHHLQPKSSLCSRLIWCMFLALLFSTVLYLSLIFQLPL